MTVPDAITPNFVCVNGHLSVTFAIRNTDWGTPEGPWLRCSVCGVANVRVLPERREAVLGKP